MNTILIWPFNQPNTVPVTNWSFTYGAPTLEQIRQVVQEEIQKAIPEDERINQLEHRLKSFVDFVENPHIAGDTLADLTAYANSLCEDTKRLLNEE